MAKKKKEVSTKKTAGKSAVKSVKKATPKKASAKKKATSKKSVSAASKAKPAKSKKASAVKKTAKTTKGNPKKVAPKKATAKKAKPVVKKAAVKASSVKSAKKAAPAKKVAPARKKTTVKKSEPAKKTAAKATRAVKNVSAAKAKTTKPVKKTAVKKKVVAVKKTVVKSTPKKAVSAKTLSAKPATSPKSPAKTGGSTGTTKTAFVKDFTLTSKADLTSEKEKESIRTNTPEASFENENGTAARETTVKAHTKIAEPKKKEIKHTISDASADPIKHLADVAVEGILEVKGRNISVLNLKNIHNRVCDYFIICQADSNTQVNAIAGSVEEMVKKMTGERPYRKEGFENAEWILVDYVTVVVHIFQSHIRNFYNLESLWADAEITELAFD